MVRAIWVTKVFFSVASRGSDGEGTENEDEVGRFEIHLDGIISEV